MGRRGGEELPEIWWWNDEVKEAVSRKKDAHKAMCWNSTDENKRRYKSMKNYTKRAMREKAGEVLAE